MDYDFIGIDKPINSTAARVLQSGEHYDSHKEISQIFSKLPIRTIPFTGYKKDNITGKKRGRLTVIGYYGKFNEKKPGVWVVRCDCGNYETRKAKAINNEYNNADCCQECREIQYFKRYHHWKETGENKKVR